jgi:DNA-directed RNA polymerase subunit RPC12/RpoP
MAARISPSISDLKSLFPVRGKSLAKSHRIVAREWHPTLNHGYEPGQFSYGSNVSCWWQCLKNSDHVWQARIYNRTLQGSGCPKCNLGAATDLRDYPKVLKTFMWSKNKRVDPYKLPWHTKVWWECPEASDHIWKSTFNRRPGARCPFCRGKKPSSTNNLTLVPAIAKQWHPTKNGKKKPTHFCIGNTTTAWWLCKKGADHEWQARIMTRTRGEGGCPYCINQKVSVTNSLARRFPEVAKQWHPTLNGKLKPKDVTSASTSKIWWVCDKGPDHVWQALVLSRTTLNTGCPCCCNKQLSVTNCLTVLNPKAAKDWHPKKNGKLKPEHVLAYTFKKAWFKCSTCKHEWRTSPQLRTARGYGCPSCRYELLRKVRKDELAVNRVDAQSIEAIKDLGGEQAVKTTGKTRATTKAKTGAKPAAKTTATAKEKAVARTKAKAGVKTKAKTGVETKAKAGVKSKAKAGVKSKAKTGIKAKAKTGSKKSAT